MDTSSLPFTIFFPNVVEVLPIPSTQEDVVSQAENYFKISVNSLSTDQRAKFLARIKELAGQILRRIQEMRQGGSSADAIRTESERLFNQLKTTGENFIVETVLNAQAIAEQNRKFDHFDQRLQNIKLELSNFVPPPPKKATNFGNMLATAKKSQQSYRHCTRDAGCYESVPLEKIPKDKTVYYHATGLTQIIDNLKSGAVERRDLQTYQGAFVSTRPETLFGNIVLVFNRTIEKAAGPAISGEYTKERGSYWSGFSSNIPVNNETLECVAADMDQETLKKLSQQLSKAAGREIKVVPLGPIIDEMREKANKDGVYVPDEWPSELQLNTNMFQRSYIY